MTKVLRIVVSPATDTTILDMGDGIIVPYTYDGWGGTDEDIKKNFSDEVSTGVIYGFEAAAFSYEEEMTDSSAKTIYTAEDGWLI